MTIVPQPSVKGLITNVFLYVIVLSTLPIFLLFLLKNNPSVAIGTFIGGIYGSIVMYNTLKLLNWWMTGEWEL